MRALLACLLTLVVLAVGSDLGQFLRAPAGASTLCCCGPAGDAHGCECTGPCCDHAPRRGRDRSMAGFDEHCGTRKAAAPAATSLQPGTPVAVRVPRPAPAAWRPAAPAAAVPAGAIPAPPEPPPRTPAA